MIENITALPTFLEPLASSMNNVIGLVQVLVGGVFGLYLIIFVWRIFDARRTKKLLLNIQKQMDSVRAAVKRIENQDRKEFKEKLNELIIKIDNKKTLKRKK